MKITRSRTLNYSLYVIVVFIVILIGFNTYLTFQFHNQISNIVSNPGRWPAGAYEYDPVIGFDFASNVSAPIKDRSFFVKSHQFGYRIGKSEDAREYTSGGVLSLGCSFTYGDEVNAEQTFTQLMADSLYLDAYNYGISSFSYIHALLKARKLKEHGVLDKLKPDYVVLGCWYGLLDRSRSPYPPVLSENIPLIAAHISRDETGLTIESPSNIEHAFELISMYRKEGTGMSFGKFTRLFVLAPKFLYLTFTHRKDQGRGRYNEDVSDFDVYHYYFTAIEDIFKEYGSRIIVLHMPYFSFDIPSNALMDAIANHPDIILVDGYQAIKDFQVSPSEYEKIHPQPKAHEAYAWKIIESLED